MNFKLETFLNSYLPMGTTRMDAIVTVNADTSGDVPSAAKTIVGLIVDTSGSMEGERILAVKQATTKAIELLDESSYFFIVQFSNQAYFVFDLAQATRENKNLAARRVSNLRADANTKMSTGLKLAYQAFQKISSAIHYAIFLTDGENDDNDEYELDNALKMCEGVFQCDCRGVGTDWKPKQLQKIARKLLGTATIIPDPSGIEADFRASIEKAKGRGIADVRLRLWTPKSVKILMCKQMSPEILDLTNRATRVDGQTLDYPTGAWGNESRDYHVAFEVVPGEVGDEILACRPSIVYQESGQTQETKITGTPVVLTWTEDESLSARINEQVAHYTGQEELAQAIQKGLEARAQNDMDTATKFLGRAAKLAADSGNVEITKRLSKVVDIVDANQGTVRLKSRVAKADEMDLDLSSSRTARANRRPKQGA